MANWGKIALFLFICLPLGFLLWCLKECCRDIENADLTERSAAEQCSPPSPPCARPENQNRSASYSPYSQKPTPPPVGFVINMNETMSLSGNRGPYHTTSCYSPGSTAPYPLSNTMSQSSISSTHPKCCPPSYAEVMHNK